MGTRTDARRSPGPARLLPALVMAWILVGACSSESSSPGSSPLPLHPVAEIDLPENNSCFDYASLAPSGDCCSLPTSAPARSSKSTSAPGRSSERSRTCPRHGVLVVPERRRVYVTATADNRLVILDEDTAAVIGQAPTGNYPDGIAYHPKRGTVWTTNESGGSEPVVDATTAQVRGTVDLGGDVGNIAYAPVANQILVAVQGKGDLAAIAPETLDVARRLPTPGCLGLGFGFGPSARLAFVACADNATLLTIDLAIWQTAGTTAVGEQPDVLAYNQGEQRLYVAAENGIVSVYDQRDRHLTDVGSGHLADGAHVVVDPSIGHTYYPDRAGTDGHPALLEQAPSP